MTPKKKEAEDWDADIPTRVRLTEGHHDLVIEDLEYTRNRFGAMSLHITTPNGDFWTGAWNVINYLRENKPVIGKTFSFDLTGSGTGRRFKNMKLS